MGPTSDATAPDALRRRLLQPTTAAFAAVAVLVALLEFAGVRIPEAVQVIPFAVSVLLFGLPHGALDHLVPARLDPGISRRRSIASVVLLYAVLGAATAAVWVVLPVVGFTLFVLVTWFHWGQGDLWLDRALGDAPASRIDAVLTVLVRGALPMLGPLVLHAHEYASVLRGTTGLLHARSAAASALLEAPVVRLAAALVLVALITVHLVVRRRDGGRPARAVVELTVLAVFFVAVPPVLAVGLYFTFWHAVRHIIRLELLTEGGRAALQRGHLLRPFGRFLRDAAPLTACAVVLLVSLALVLRSADLGTYLLLIAALTTPHTAVVTWMDRRRSQRLTALRRAGAEDPARRAS